MRDPLSLILLPTLRCNARCDYCFENRKDSDLSMDQLDVILRKVLDHMDENAIGTLNIHWQGGDVMTLPPKWFGRAHEIILRNSEKRKKEVRNYIQTNMIGYSRAWNGILREMFANSVGTSLDFPNLHRKLPVGDAKGYDDLLLSNIRKAQDAGILLGAIAIPNDETFRAGAERFYSHFTEEMGITNFQVNTPFPGGLFSESKKGFPLDTDDLTRFFLDLIDAWIAHGYEKGVKLGPFDKLMDYFIEGNQGLVCIWRSNCADEFFCIDPAGYVSQCDCWAASYPEFRFGNILDCERLSEMLTTSAARQCFLDRPACLVQQEACRECRYLSLCHGGCPVRAYTVSGNLTTRDPYCETYKAIFSYMETVSSKLAMGRFQRQDSAAGACEIGNADLQSSNGKKGKINESREKQNVACRHCVDGPICVGR